MIATDFIYDGQRLSDLGYCICQFDEGGGFVTSSAGSQLTFYPVAANCGRNYWMAGSKYESVFETDISICKPDGAMFTPDEYAYLMRWLNRTGYHDLYLGNVPVVLDDVYLQGVSGDFILAMSGTTPQTYDPIAIMDSSFEYDGIHFRGTFNVDKVEHRGAIIGFTLHFTTDGPFGYGDPVKHVFDLEAGERHTITDVSDEVGYIYPDKFKLISHGSGNLVLTNSVENRRTAINNISDGEMITCDNKVANISTSLATHKILNDFNYNFPRIANTYENRDNVFSSNLACTIELTYTPRRKVVF